MRRVVAIGLICLLACAAAALDVSKYDPARRFITDQTGTLTPQQAQTLNTKAEELFRSDSTEIAILIIPSLEGDSLEDFAQRVFETWGIGQKGKNNGVLFLIAKNDRKMRIHTGYGLEARLTDALSDRIMRNEVRPEFRNNQWYNGIDRAMTSIVQAVRGEYKADARPAAGSKSSGPIGWILLLIWIGVWGWVIVAAVRASRRATGKRARRSSWTDGVWSTPGWSSGGSWTSGHRGGGGGIGGFGGGGGSFGGGSSGGGGASGSW